MIKRGLTLVNAMHITASVFINDDETRLHHDYEVWLEEVCSRLHPAPHAPIDQAGSGGRLRVMGRDAEQWWR